MAKTPIYLASRLPAKKKPLPKPQPAPKPKKPKPIAATKAKPIAPVVPHVSYNAEQQSNLDAWKIVNPQIDAAKKASLETTAAGMAAIQGYTDQLAKSLASYNPGEIYGRAQASLQGINDSIRGGLQGGGQELSGQLGAALSQIGAPGNYAGEQAQIGQQSGAAQFGLGSADLAAITQSRAAAEDYAAKLPGIAGFTGLQSARSLQLQQAKQVGDTVRELTAQVPQLQAQRYQQIKENQSNAAKLKLDQQNSALDAKLAERAFGLKQTTETNNTVIDVARLKQTAADKAADRAAKARIAAQNNATKENIARANNAAKAAATAAKAAQKATETAAKTKKARADAFYKARTQAVKDAQAAFATGRTPAQVSAYLHSAYGPVLLGRGFTQAQVDQMIRAAIQAGKANPTTGSKAKPKTAAGAGTLVP